MEILSQQKTDKLKLNGPAYEKKMRPTLHSPGGDKLRNQDSKGRDHSAGAS